MDKQIYTNQWAADLFLKEESRGARSFRIQMLRRSANAIAECQIERRPDDSSEPFNYVDFLQKHGGFGGLKIYGVKNLTLKRLEGIIRQHVAISKSVPWLAISGHPTELNPKNLMAKTQGKKRKGVWE